MSDAAETALLIMDVQKGVMARMQGAEELPGRLAVAAAAARTAGVGVIFVTARYLPGHPEVGPEAGAGFRQLRELGAFTAADPNADLHEALSVEDGDVVVTKKRFSGFSGGELAIVLRAGGYRHLVLAGVKTSGVVLSTAREAFDLDYRLTILSDGCFDPDEEVDRVLLEKVLPNQAEVTTIAEWTAGLA